MNGNLLQLLILAGIAVFLILRLRNVLGSREGFEKPPAVQGATRTAPRRDFEVIDGGPDRDITDHVEDGSDQARALAAMKLAEPGFSVGDFMQGARGAYEMILMAFENGDLAEVEELLDPDVRGAFEQVIAERAAQNLSIEANFVGLREISLVDATFDRGTATAEITIRFVGELTWVVRNAHGDVVDGDPEEIKRQRDVWTFQRAMGRDDPNWVLSATGE